MHSNNHWPHWKDFLDSDYIRAEKSDGGLRKQRKFKSSTNSRPLVSYVTVIRNNEKDIKRVIESVQKQTYPNVEHIILDGASTDKTFGIIQEYGETIDYYASEPDKGLYDALNKAIPLCRGDLICVLNSDDWLPENAAEIVVHNYKHTDKELILGAAKVKIDEKNHTIWKPSTVSLSSYFSIANVCHNAMYATKGCYESSGPYDVAMRIASDFKWIMACFEKDVKFIYLDDVTVNYSLGGISSDSTMHIIEAQQLLREKFPFLTENEIKKLNYIFYPWRYGLEHADYKSFRHEPFLVAVLEKYKQYPEFIEAIGLKQYKQHQTRYLRMKEHLRQNFPFIFKQLKMIRRFLRSLSQ